MVFMWMRFPNLFFIAQIKPGPLQNYASWLKIKFAAGIIEIGALGLEQWPRELKKMVCQRDINQIYPIHKYGKYGMVSAYDKYGQ